EKMEGILGGIEALPVPTLAVIEGFAIGGGGPIPAGGGPSHPAPRPRLRGSVPGPPRQFPVVVHHPPAGAPPRGSRAPRQVLLLAENLSAEEALAAGFLAEIVEAGDLDRRVGELCSRLAQHAPITMRVSKEAIARLLHAGLPDGDDLVRACYGSDDFRLGVEA